MSADDAPDIESKETPAQTSVSIKGIIFGTVSQLMYSMTSPIVKILFKHNPQISNFEIIYWKSLSMILFNYLFSRSLGVFVLDVPREY